MDLTESVRHHLAVAQTFESNFSLILTSFLQNESLPFAEVLPEETIQRIVDDERASFANEPDAVYTPAITLWAFLSQVLFKGEQRSCIAAVARVVVLLVTLERGPCSDNTGAYCRARAKLSACFDASSVYIQSDRPSASERSAARLAHRSGGPGVASSNLAAPTIFP